MAEADTPTRSELNVPESPKVHKPEVKVANAEAEMEIEVQRDDGHMAELGVAASPPPDEPSQNIHPDETIDDEQVTPPSHRPPPKRLFS